eukprot:TRINITY_DN4425_c0_g1_i1.p1 TRINITY_DN4425_c0_g1~~TRINITY_DN4425_c0_g1_i1.p1  ORF type:complete len:657 (+),score=216.76 TRINITY_DN4425_c0_g1_i1:108-2078(+)
MSNMFPQNTYYTGAPPPQAQTWAAPPTQPNPFFQPTPAPNPAIYTQPSYTSPTDPQTVAQQWVQFNNSKVVAPEPAKSTDPFGGLVSAARKISSPPPVHVQPQAVPEPAPLALAPAPVEAAPAPTPAPKVVTKVITKTVTNTTEINKLKARIEELENELARLHGSHSSLEQRLAEREALIAELTAARQQIALLSEEAEKERKEIIQENDKLRQELDHLLNARERERFNRAVAQLDSQKQSIDLLLNQLDNPTNMGNQDATPLLVIEDGMTLSQVATRLAGLCSTNPSDPNFDVAGHEKDFFEAAASIANALRDLFQDTKGASRLVEDDKMRTQFLDGARRVGTVTNMFLGTARQMGGVAHDEADRAELNGAFSHLQGAVNSLVEVARQADISIQQAASKQTESTPAAEAPLDTSGLDLDDLAERELINAARQIEEAARVLMAAKAAKPPREPNHQMDVSEAILEAATAITQATATLVSAAAAAQRERTEKGRANVAAGLAYRRDPTWAEGLVSAAKAVAAATSQLVGVANKAANGEVGDQVEEALVAASKAVAASTSQLVAAARAKSDVNSPSQEKLTTAAKSVSQATALLLAAAKAAAAKDEDDMEADYAKLSVTGYKVKEMEQQMLILRLEKELQKARNSLANMRKAEYAQEAK